MTINRKKALLPMGALVLLAILVAIVFGRLKTSASTDERPLAIVHGHVITASDLDFDPVARREMLRNAGIPEDALDSWMEHSFRRQIESAIWTLFVQIEAERAGIVVSDDEVQAAMDLRQRASNLSDDDLEQLRMFSAALVAALEAAAEAPERADLIYAERLAPILDGHTGHLAASVPFSRDDWDHMRAHHADAALIERLWVPETGKELFTTGWEFVRSEIKEQKVLQALGLLDLNISEQDLQNEMERSGLGGDDPEQVRAELILGIQLDRTWEASAKALKTVLDSDSLVIPDDETKRILTQ